MSKRSTKIVVCTNDGIHSHLVAEENLRMALRPAVNEMLSQGFRDPIYSIKPKTVGCLLTRDTESVLISAINTF